MLSMSTAVAVVLYKAAFEPSAVAHSSVALRITLTAWAYPAAVCRSGNLGGPGSACSHRMGCECPTPRGSNPTRSNRSRTASGSRPAATPAYSTPD